MFLTPPFKKRLTTTTSPSVRSRITFNPLTFSSEIFEGADTFRINEGRQKASKIVAIALSIKGPFV